MIINTSIINIIERIAYWHRWRILTETGFIAEGCIWCTFPVGQDIEHSNWESPLCQVIWGHFQINFLEHKWLTFLNRGLFLDVKWKFCLWLHMMHYPSGRGCWTPLIRVPKWSDLLETLPDLFFFSQIDQYYTHLSQSKIFLPWPIKPHARMKKWILNELIE